MSTSRVLVPLLVFARLVAETFPFIASKLGEMQRHCQDFHVYSYRQSVLETCRYGTMWFWLQAISDFHSNHCYSHQDTIHKLRHGMVDYILSHPFEEYGTYRKASYHEITPLLCGQRIRYNGKFGLVQHVDISPERERKIVWDTATTRFQTPYQKISTLNFSMSPKADKQFDRSRDSSATHGPLLEF